jgi:hypothetical protein
MEIKVGSLFVSKQFYGAVVPVIVTEVATFAVQVYNLRMSRSFRLNRDIFVRYYSPSVGE